jgi:peptidyl-prolyl cis-trans isomerase A (cyclophilin A)
MKTVMNVIVIFIFLSCSHPKYKEPRVLIETKFGDIEIEVYPAKAPKSVAAFLSYIDSGFYKNSSFYRVLNEDNQPSASFKSELIQGGIWQTNYKKGISLPGIPHESTKQTGILHKDGTISLARTTPGTASSEFFICIGDQPTYDYGGAANSDGQGFAAFGKVVKGMDIVRKIHRQPDYEESFDPPVEIFNIKRL